MYLLLSVLCSSLIFVIFKYFDRMGVNTLQAIIFNYFFACSAGLLLDGQGFEFSNIPSEGWFPGTLVMGILFISVFYLAAITTQRSGLSVVSVATKMSVAIPAIAGVLLYDERTGPVKVIGIVLALVAVYLTSIKKKDGITIRKRNLIFPLLVFFGSGVIDTSLKFLETTYVAPTAVALFTATIFAVAGCIGIIVLLIQGLRRELELKLKNLVAGLVLGIPNFGSIYFLVLALRKSGAESSTIFPLNNVAIVLVSTFLGFFLFRERLLFKNWIGIAMAVLSIILITTAEQWTK